MNWNEKSFCTTENLDTLSWQRGFFYRGAGVWERDFDELRIRDIALFSLGQIEGKKILDVGCGSGLYMLTFLKMGAAEVAGQDMSSKVVDMAKVICSPYSNVSFKIGDCQALQFDDNEFDAVFSGDVFEHITKELKINFISEAYRVLKPGGIFTIKTPNKDYLRMSNFLRRIKAIVLLKNPFNIYIPHTHNNPDNEHHGLSTYSEFRKLFRNTMFHEPVITAVPLHKNKITKFISRMFPGFKYLNSQIVITVHKPVFYGFWQR